MKNVTIVFTYEKLTYLYNTLTTGLQLQIFLHIWRNVFVMILKVFL